MYIIIIERDIFMVYRGITMSFCDTLLYIEKLEEVWEESWSSNDDVEEKLGFSSSWSWR